MVHVYRQTDTQINPQSFSVRPAQQTVIRQQHQLQIGNGSTGAVIRTSLHFRSGGTQILNVVVGQLHGNVQRQLRESRCADSLPSLDCETHTPSSLWNGSAASRDTRPLSERRWEDASPRDSRKGNDVLPECCSASPWTNRCAKTLPSLEPAASVYANSSKST